MVAPSTILFEICGKNGEPLDHQPEYQPWHDNGREASSNMELSENGGTQKWLVYVWLVVSTLLKNMSSSVGSMTFSTEWKVIKFMFQTTSNHQPAIEMDENWGYPQFRKPPYGDQRGVARLETFCDSLPVPAGPCHRFMSPAKPWVFFDGFQKGLRMP